MKEIEEICDMSVPTAVLLMDLWRFLSFSLSNFTMQ